MQYVCQRNIENGAQNTPSIRYWKGWMCLEMYSIDKLFDIAQIFEFSADSMYEKSTGIFVEKCISVSKNILFFDAEFCCFLAHNFRQKCAVF